MGDIITGDGGLDILGDAGGSLDILGDVGGGRCPFTRTRWIRFRYFFLLDRHVCKCIRELMESGDSLLAAINTRGVGFWVGSEARSLACIWRETSKRKCDKIFVFTEVQGREVPATLKDSQPEVAMVKCWCVKMVD